MLVCAVFGLCHGASTQVEFCFLFLGGPSVSFFSFLAPRLACPCLCLCVCVCVCFRKSCFVLSAALAWFRFAGPSRPPSLPPSLPPSRPPLSGARGAGGSWDVTGAPLSAHPAPSPRRPPASPWHVPPPPWNRVGDRVSFVAASRGEISRLLSLPLRPGSRRVASLGGGGSGPSSGVWAAGAVASPAAGDSHPSSGRSSRLSGATWRPLVYCPSSSGASASPSGGL